MNSLKPFVGGFVLAVVVAGAFVAFDRKQVVELLGVQKKHNLQDVTCASQTIVVNPNIGTSNDDEMIFVCNGQTVTWTNPGGADFSIDFGTDWPFDGNPTAQNSQNQSLGPLTVTKNPPNGARAKAYKYSLSIGGGTPFDPHVIIMGGNVYGSIGSRISR